MTLKEKIQAAWNNKGNVLNDLKKYELALESYDKCIEINPSNVDAWINKGNLYSEIKLLDLSNVLSE